MKIILILSLLLNFNAIANATLGGTYTFLNGPSECPTGFLKLKKNLKSKERILIFGSKKSWLLNDKNYSHTTENVDGGCYYTLQYELTDISFNAKTTRKDCPRFSENATITESIELKKRILKYSYKLV